MGGRSFRIGFVDNSTRVGAPRFVDVVTPMIVGVRVAGGLQVAFITD